MGRPGGAGPGQHGQHERTQAAGGAVARPSLSRAGRTGIPP
ncbi:hypothetical protein SXCC_01811 [Gluconacetobacter sp. SXCC-1]|nr:hypothetical protein SXCC_01811 [Gluconacetobacter sp. SXCC-1]